jgi:hypothetical protein
MSKKHEDAAGSATDTKASVSSGPTLQLKKVAVYRERTNDLDTSQGRANAYKNLAGEICHSAREMRDEDSTAQYILVFHALELALKGYLIHAGLKEEQLSRHPYSHNLTNAYAEAKRRGLHVLLDRANEPDDTILRRRGASVALDKVDLIIQWANEFHNRGFLRYNIANALLPSCLDVFPILDEILKAVSAGMVTRPRS